MKNKSNLITAAIVVYLLVAIATFGHAWKTNYNNDNQYQRDNGLYQIGAILDSIAWPFYWSYVFWN